jgi:hypothetical protein
MKLTYFMVADPQVVKKEAAISRRLQISQETLNRCWFAVLIAHWHESRLGFGGGGGNRLTHPPHHHHPAPERCEDTKQHLIYYKIYTIYSELFNDASSSP